MNVGEAIVLGFEEEFIARIGERKTPHGGETPEFQPVKVDLTKFNEILSSVEPKEEVKAEKTGRVEREVERLRTERDRLKEKVASLESEVQKLRDALESKDEVYRDEIEELRSEIESYRARIKEYEEEISKASDIERELENIREAAKAVFDAIVEFSEVLGMELLPSDVTELKRRIEELEEKLRIYEMTEKERKIRVKEVLEDRAVKSWIEDAQHFLHRLKTKSGVFPLVMKQALRIDPEVVFRAEDFDVGVTTEIVKRYLKELASKGLLIETHADGRLSFKNGFMLWVSQNIRKIRPTAPDEAIDEIATSLLEYVFE